MTIEGIFPNMKINRLPDFTNKLYHHKCVNKIYQKYGEINADNLDVDFQVDMADSITDDTKAKLDIYNYDGQQDQL